MDVQDDENADNEQATDEAVETEHDVTDAQQVDAAQGVAGTGEEQHGHKVGLFVVVELLSCMVTERVI